MSEPSLSNWDGCIHRQAELAPGSSKFYPFESVPGDGAVLSLSASWGKLPIITDTGSYTSLLVELPPLAAGETIEIDDQEALYREGGQVLGYESTTLTGTVHVGQADVQRVELVLDLTARSPTVDPAKQGEVGLSGTVLVPAVDGNRCP